MGTGNLVRPERTANRCMFRRRRAPLWINHGVFCAWEASSRNTLVERVLVVSVCCAKCHYSMSRLPQAVATQPALCVCARVSGCGCGCVCVCSGYLLVRPTHRRRPRQQVGSGRSSQVLLLLLLSYSGQVVGGWVWIEGMDGQRGRAWAELSGGCTVSMSSARISGVG